MRKPLKITEILFTENINTVQFFISSLIQKFVGTFSCQQDLWLWKSSIVYQLIYLPRPPKSLAQIKCNLIVHQAPLRSFSHKIESRQVLPTTICRLWKKLYVDWHSSARSIYDQFINRLMPFLAVYIAGLASVLISRKTFQSLWKLQKNS